MSHKSVNYVQYLKKSSLRVTDKVLYLYNYYLYKNNNKLFKKLRWLFQNICSNNYTCNNGTYKLWICITSPQCIIAHGDKWTRVTINNNSVAEYIYHNRHKAQYMKLTINNFQKVWHLKTNIHSNCEIDFEVYMWQGGCTCTLGELVGSHTKLEINPVLTIWRVVIHALLDAGFKGMQVVAYLTNCQTTKGILTKEFPIRSGYMHMDK